jgi:hypothetical protein
LLSRHFSFSFSSISLLGLSFISTLSPILFVQSTLKLAQGCFSTRFISCFYALKKHFSLLRKILKVRILILKYQQSKYLVIRSLTMNFKFYRIFQKRLT